MVGRQRILAGLFLLGVLPLPVAGQSGFEIDLTPHLGLAWSSETERGVRLDDGNFLDVAPSDPSAALGVSVRIGRTDAPWGVQLSVLRVLESSATGTWNCVAERDTEVCPAVLIRVPATVAMTAVSVGAVFDLTGRTSPLRPFVAFGVGAKVYEFGWRSGGGFSGGSDGGTAVGPRFGIGMEWTWRRVAAVVQVDDHAARLDGNPFVHNALLSAGMRLRVH